MNFIKLAILIFFLPLLGWAHPGGLDSEGCHFNKKTNEKHCHSKKNITQSQIQETLPTQTPTTSDDNKILQLDYSGFTIWIDCNKKAAVKFRYNASHDNGNNKRESEFNIDSAIPKNCQQKTHKAYGKSHDRGHLVPANHLDHSKQAIKQSNLMTNILPQHQNMNRGAWLHTEEITECYRDIDELLVIGGVVWGQKKNLQFMESHGVETPEAFWKFIIRGKPGSESVNAWIIPNSENATYKKLDEYLVSPADIEKITKDPLPVPEYLKNEKPRTSWLIPQGCNKS